VPRAGRPLRLARLGRLLRPPVPARPPARPQTRLRMAALQPARSPPPHTPAGTSGLRPTAASRAPASSGGHSSCSPGAIAPHSAPHSNTAHPHALCRWERLLFTRLEFYGTLFCSEALPFKRSLRRRVRDTRSAADGSSSGGGGGGGASAPGGRVAAQFVVAGQDALGLDAAIAFAHGLQPPGAAPDGTNVI
jgi:hypothetical protein